MTDVKWIKLSTDMFDDEKIDFIQSLPEGDALLVIWVRLLTMAGKCNANGYIFLTENIPYNEETLSFKFKKPVNVVKLAMQTFQNLNMIEINNRGIELVNWSKYQSLEGLDRIKEKEYERIKKQKQRDKTKKLQGHSKEKNSLENKMSPKCPGNVPGTLSIIEKEREIDIEIELDNRDKIIDTRYKEVDIEQGDSLAIYQEIVNEFNKICKSLPQVSILDDNRKSLLDKCLAEFGDVAVFIKVFQKAQESDFLSGRNEKWQGCSFDWLVTLANMTKTLEGNYDNKNHNDRSKDSFNDFDQRNYDFEELERKLLGWESKTMEN